MEEGKIRHDKITPYFIEGFVKWWESSGRDDISSMMENSGPCRMDIDPSYATELESRITSSYSDFLKEYPYYRIDPLTFRFAYVYHPLHWRSANLKEGSIALNYRKISFKKIVSCVDTRSYL